MPSGITRSFDNLSVNQAKVLDAVVQIDTKKQPVHLIVGAPGETLVTSGPHHSKSHGPNSLIYLDRGQRLENRSDRIPGKMRRGGKLIGISVAAMLGGAALAGIATALYYNCRVMPPPYSGGYGYGWGGWGGGWGGPYGYGGYW
jgi:hypothetical protein